MRIAILAPFTSFDDSYSLSSVVADQALALSRKHEVSLVTMRTALLSHKSAASQRLVGSNVEIWGDMQPAGFFADNTDPHRIATHLRSLEKVFCNEQKYDAIITHDCLYQAGYIDIAAAIHAYERLHPKQSKWFHYVHSVIPPARPVPDEHTKYRLTLPEGHFALYPNAEGREAVAKWFDVSKDRVFTCRNPRPAASAWNVSKPVRRIVRELSLDTRDIVQVYPLCTTRMTHKGLPTVIELFKALAKRDENVTLVVANSNGRGGKEKDALASMRALWPHGVDAGQLYFTSGVDEYEQEVPSADVSSLMRFANLFFFPSMGEAGPLVLAEAAMSGCYCIVNENIAGIQDQYPYALPRAFNTFNKTVHYKARQEVRDNETGVLREVREITGAEAFSHYMEELAGHVWREMLQPHRVSQRWAMKNSSEEAALADLETVFHKTMSA